MKFVFILAAFAVCGTNAKPQGITPAKAIQINLDGNYRETINKIKCWIDKNVVLLSQSLYDQIMKNIAYLAGDIKGWNSNGRYLNLTADIVQLNASMEYVKANPGRKDVRADPYVKLMTLLKETDRMLAGTYLFVYIWSIQTVMFIDRSVAKTRNVEWFRHTFGRTPPSNIVANVFLASQHSDYYRQCVYYLIHSLK